MCVACTGNENYVRNLVGKPVVRSHSEDLGAVARWIILKKVLMNYNEGV